MPEGETAHSTVQEENEPIANLCDVGWGQENMSPSSFSQNWLEAKPLGIRKAPSLLYSLLPPSFLFKTSEIFLGIFAPNQWPSGSINPRPALAIPAVAIEVDLHFALAGGP